MRQWRTKLTNKEAYIQSKPWMAILPSLARQKAVEEFFQAKKESLKRTSKGVIAHFKMKKKRKYRSRQEQIPFERHKIRSKGRFVDVCVDRKPLTFKVVGKVPTRFRGREDASFLRKEIKLIKTRVGKWFLAIPIVIPIQNPIQNNDVCALDPGVRVFQTLYGTDGTVADIGNNFAPILKELKKADRLISLRKKLSTARKRRNNRLKKLRCFQRARNKIRDLHHKLPLGSAKHID